MGLSWSTAPPLSGPVLADLGAVVEGSWVEIDVTTAVTGNGTFSFGASTTSSNSVRYASKESTSPPQLVLTLGGSPPPPTPPVASFTASPTSGTAPLPVQFNDTSTGGATSWTWDFGGAGTSSAQSPAFTFNQPGTYQVQLTASNGAGSSTATLAITVTEAGSPPEPTTLAIAKDTFVNTGSPTKNYGDYAYLRGLASPTEYRSFVGFNVSGLTAAPTRVALRLYVTDSSDQHGGTWSSVTSTWSEDTLNWNNAPQPSGSVVADVGPVSSGNWIEVDLTTAVTGNGSYSFIMTTTSTSSFRYASRESATPPVVVIT
jgi:PKD repeat protein